MKRYLTLILTLAFIGYANLYGKNITVSQAMQKAYEFWGKQMPKKAKARCRQAATMALGEQNSKAYYVFNNDEGGFVIVAGNDAVCPVLGYTTSGTFDENNIPSGLKDLLGNYSMQISSIAEDAPAYDASSKQTRSTNEPKKLNTAKWDQYTKYTPDNCPAGCIATAAAIVMKYHGWPVKGIGSHSYQWNGQTLSANFEHIYNWASMPNENAAQNDEVERLMSDIGIATEMNYGKEVSETSMAKLLSAMKTYFSYSDNAAYKSIDDYSQEDWKTMLQEEIDADRPVIYSAMDENGKGGHAFIVDGYDDERFSINWGWANYNDCDGFYYIGALNPKTNTESNLKFNLSQAAIIGLKEITKSYRYARANLSDDGILTFFYDEKSDKGTAFIDNSGIGDFFWKKDSKKIKKVIFDGSFFGIKLKTCLGMFWGCENMEAIEGIEYFNTSLVKDMMLMFSGCKSLKELDLSHFSTSNVTNMSSMFEECTNLRALDVSRFETKKVANMKYMFNNCKNLTQLDVSNFNTSKVTDMENMFKGCSNLTTLDVSNFNTSKVANMDNMFYGCSNLAALDVSNFTTDRVTSMKCMFYGCSSLSALDVSNFNTSRVTDMTNMFRECGKLTNLDLSSFDTKEVRYMGSMFAYDTNLIHIYANENFSTENVSSASYMFIRCTSLIGAIAYDGSKDGKEYANYTTGYFTYKPYDNVSDGIGSTTITHKYGQKEYYDLQGHRILYPKKGIHIVRQNGKTKKLVVK